MKSLLIICIFIFNSFFSSLIAQDTISKPPYQMTFKWPSWRLDGKKINRSELGYEILKVKAAVPLYQKSQRNKTRGYIVMGSAAILAILGKTETDIASPRFGKNNLGIRSGLYLHQRHVYFL